MKRLLLINPSTASDARQAPTVAGVASMEPLGLAYVAALTPPDWQVCIWDEVLEPLPAQLDADLVGISVLTASAPRSYELAGALRRQGIPVVLGGQHPTVLPDEAARYGDVVFCGEAEGAWPQLIADFEAGKLQPRYEGGGPSLDELVIPQRQRYRQRYVVNLISASRGCRYRCEFCAIWKLDCGTLRLRPVEHVWAELRGMRKGWVTLFSDDNIMADRDWSVALFRGIAERGLARRIAVQASLNVADDDELLHWLRRAGCFAVMTGLESISETSLATMRKGVNLRIGVEHYREKIARIHAHGLMIAATFIFGNDGDGPDIFERTARFVVDAGVDLAHFGILRPFPGTDLTARLEREGRLLYTDFPVDHARQGLNQALFVPNAMTPAELEHGMQQSAAEISRWPVLLRRSWRTWRETGNPFAALISLAWTRTSLRARANTG